MGAFLAAAVSLFVREGAVSWSRSATGAVTMTKDSWQHTDRMRQGIYVCMGEFLAAAVSLFVREGAVTSSHSATGAVTIITRHSKALPSHASGFYVGYIMRECSGSRDAARCS